MNRCFAAALALLAIGCGKIPTLQVERPSETTGPSQALLERIGNLNDVSRPRPLITLEEFFEGNEDPGSIGYNLPDPPTPRDFYTLLKELRDRDDVADIRIEVKDIEGPGGWPSTDTIWFITSASSTDVRSWFPDRLAPDELIEGFERLTESVEPYTIPEGMRAIGAWYD